MNNRLKQIRKIDKLFRDSQVEEKCANCGKQFTARHVSRLVNAILKHKPACSDKCTEALGQAQKRRARFDVLCRQGNVITIRDTYSNGRANQISITNDAEEVIKSLTEQFGLNIQIEYYDTDGRLDRLIHDRGKFITFAPGPWPKVKLLLNT